MPAGAILVMRVNNLLVNNFAWDKGVEAAVEVKNTSPANEVELEESPPDALELEESPPDAVELEESPSDAVSIASKSGLMLDKRR